MPITVTFLPDSELRTPLIRAIRRAKTSVDMVCFYWKTKYASGGTPPMDALNAVREVAEEYMNQLMQGGTLIAQIPPPPPPDEEQEGFEGGYRRVFRVLLLEVVREYRRAQRIPQTTVGRK